MQYLQLLPTRFSKVLEAVSEIDKIYLLYFSFLLYGLREMERI